MTPVKEMPDSPATEAERAWWLRVPLVLQAPRAVFAALRDDSEASASARQEPATALAFLAGVAVILASSVGGEILDDPELDRLLVPFWILFAGAAQAIAVYWIGGGFLHLGVKGLDGRGSYRRTRHLLAFATTPLVLGVLALWPVRLAVYGSDLFRAGGDDGGAGNVFFEVGEAACAAWALGLLILGVRVVHGWSWSRAAGACVLGGSALAALAALFVLAA